MNFGFTINQPRSINLDRNDLSISRKLLEELPELETCIACGNCTATCTAGNLTSFARYKPSYDVENMMERKRSLPNVCSAANVG